MTKMTTITAALALAVTASVGWAGGFGAAGTEGQCAQEQRDKDGKCPALIIPVGKAGSFGAGAGVGGLSTGAVIGGVVAAAALAAASNSSGSH